ncbi:phage tail sheath family protein [Pyxidicoccus sp. 3LG]
MTMTFSSPGVYVKEVPSGNAPIVGVGTSTAGFVGLVPDELTMPDFNAAPKADGEPADSTTKLTVPTPAGVVKLITNFTEFKDAFGDFSKDDSHRALAHAVLGFFTNGGTRCFVTRVKAVADVSAALELLEPIDEIAIVAAPCVPPQATDHAIIYTALKDHCESGQNRFAVLDSMASYADANGKLDVSKLAKDSDDLPENSTYTAFYFPWVEVFDPATRKRKLVPPSGHIAGIYARVDTERGVHKAPANEPIRGVLGLQYAISRRQQDGLNPHGVNCLRTLNGNTRVWGARTMGGDANGEFKYLSTRRLFIFLRESIDRGMQWAVFEPNNPDLWARLVRNVSAFLSGVWRAGALFGAKPEDAFFVKCDAENNPPVERELGKVVTDIGVAVTKPAEFVIFRIGQKALDS